MASLKDFGETSLPATEEEDLDELDTVQVPKIKARKRNAVAVANLTMAFTTDEAMSIVYDSATTSWPSGLAWKIIKAMKKKYQPEDTIS